LYLKRRQGKLALMSVKTQTVPGALFGSLSGKQPETIFCNSGKIVEFKGKEISILNSGIHGDGVPYVDLKPKNAELKKLMIKELRERRMFTVIVGGTQQLVLGKKLYPYR
jgi:hypothetical protein